MRAAVRLRNLGGTSPPVPSEHALTMGGSLGSEAAPRIVTMTASDPDNSGAAYSNGDLITILFDVAVLVKYRFWWDVMPTDPNIGGLVKGVGGPRLYVNGLFDFSGKLGEDYSGVWQDTSTFVITLTDTTAAYGTGVGELSMRVKRCPVRTDKLCADVSKRTLSLTPSLSLTLTLTLTLSLALARTLALF